MKNLKWAVYLLVLTCFFIVIVPGSVRAQDGGDDPCCGSQPKVLVIDPTIDPSLDGPVIIIIDPTPSEPDDSSTPESTDPSTQTGTVPVSRLDLRQLQAIRA